MSIQALSPERGSSPQDPFGDSTLPEKERDLEDEWEADPDSARNWSSKRKWATTVIVSIQPSFNFFSELKSPFVS